ncbi:MAG TPA: RecX family transcriptional regulator [Ignavibacteria bacterium]|nr:RecX family transcriptional regulator [Ignavibacteria bacterium]
MKITDIQKQKKEGRYNIYIDGEFAFGLYKETIYNYGLRKNDELTEEKIKEITHYDEITFGTKVAYNYLTYSPRSTKEIRTKLRAKKLKDENIEEIIQHFTEYKFLDDELYAKSYIENQKIKKPSGKISIRQKLSQKGIDKEIIEKVIAENYDNETELTNGISLLEKYLAKHKSVPKEKIKQKSFSYLLSRGFEYSLISEILRNVLKPD